MNIKMKATTILLIVGLLAAIAIPFASACSTRTPGYWKNHYPGAWPASATITYTDSSVPPHTNYSWLLPGGTLAGAENILNMPDKGDARINLEQKVIAAMLSISADNRVGWAYAPNYAGGPMGGETLPQLITDSIALLNAHPGPWTPGSAAALSGIRAQGLAYASAIDYWLNFFDEAPI